MKRIIVIALLVLLSGCSTVAQKDVWDRNAITQPRSILGMALEGESETKGAWIPIERYTCKGTSCKATFKSGGEVEGGNYSPLKSLKLGE